MLQVATLPPRIGMASLLCQRDAPAFLRFLFARSGLANTPAVFLCTFQVGPVGYRINLRPVHFFPCQTRKASRSNVSPISILPRDFAGGCTFLIGSFPFSPPYLSQGGVPLYLDDAGCHPVDEKNYAFSESLTPAVLTCRRSSYRASLPFPRSVVVLGEGFVFSLHL